MSLIFHSLMCLLEPLHPWPALCVYLLGAGTIQCAAQQRKGGGATVPPLVPTKLFRSFSPAPFPQTESNRALACGA